MTVRKCQQEERTDTKECADEDPAEKGDDRVDDRGFSGEGVEVGALYGG